MKIRPAFSSKKEALDWMYKEVDDLCVDNERFAYYNDEKAMAAYDKQVDEGCCGSFDQDVVINGRLARIGCNYGH